MAALQRLADRYESTGEGEAELSAEFQRFIERADVLVIYMKYLSGKPSEG
jgi:hypothetical protein